MTLLFLKVVTVALIQKVRQDLKGGKEVNEERPGQMEIRGQVEPS